MSGDRPHGSPARQRRPIRGHLLFSHHPEAEADGWRRCVCLPLGPGRMLPLCARCLAIYPLAALLLTLSLLGRLSLAFLDGWGLWLLPLPAWIEAVTDWLGWRRGTNASRVLTGLLLAPALARLFEIYLDAPLNRNLWQVVLVYGLSAACAAIIGRLQTSDGGQG